MDIRQKLRRKRNALSDKRRFSKDLALSVHLEKWLKSAYSKNIAAYLANDGEVGLEHWLQTTQALLWLPAKDASGAVEFRQAPSELRVNNLETGFWKTLQPKADSRKINPMDLDLVLVPCVAVDADGNRLGRGKGHYDSIFGNLKNLPAESRAPFLLGVSYEFQRIKKLKPKSWDLRLNGLITEKGVTIFPSAVNLRQK